MFKLTLDHRKSLRWCGWFFTANMLLFWLIGLKYTHSISWLDTNYLTAHGKHTLAGFLTVSYLGQLAILAYLPSVLIGLLILVVNRRYFIFSVSVLIAALFAGVLISDTIVYSLFRFHINGIVLNLILHSSNEQFFDFSPYEYVVCIAVSAGLVLFETLIAYLIWYYVIQRDVLRGIGKWIAIFVSLCVYTSYTMLIFSFNHNLGRVMIEAVRVLPLYTEFLGAMLPMQNGRLALERAFERYLIQPAQAYQSLHYPLQDLKFIPPERHLNVVIIGVDAWRFDMLDESVTPNMFQFAKQAWVYKNHSSGGDATGPGIFSLFYGLPATYWTAMEVQKRGPILLDELIKHNYQMKILASAGLTMPAFNKNVFSAIKDLKLKFRGKNPYIRDLAVTKEFEKFIDQVQVNQQPFFSFLFYDTAHSYCAVPNDLRPFKPAVKVCDRLSLTNQSDPLPYLNRYKNALHLADQQVGEVLNYLKSHHLLESTVVVITGDHGEEFNDNHLGYWGHASNFTHYQVRTPLIIYWPGSTPKTITQGTSHFDIVPTLMEKVLGCKSQPNVYSMGNSLLHEQIAPYLIVGSYIGFGIVEKDRITTVFPTGNFQVTQLDGKILTDAKIHPPLMQAIFQDMRRFYR
ncbi:MAG: DUF3413 domain-containing protein [Gammaproteobacteria bacterium]